eukprot:gene1903-2237_t
MAGELQSNSREQLGSGGGLAFKLAGVAAVVAANSDGSTPRRYIKLLHAIVGTLQKHHEQLQSAVVTGLKELDHAVTEAAHTHSAAASGKLHHFLTEDRQLRKLQATAGALQDELQCMAKLTTYVAAGFQADIDDVLNKLSAAKCSLPSSQLHLIDQFRKLAAGLDPASPEVPDGIQKSAEQVVRQVINEVHGPFFNEEILDKELTHLERAAQHLDAVQQRQDAALVKLLASTLMQAPMRLQPEGLTKLVQFLQQSPRVRGLSLAHNWIGADGAQRVCQALMVHQSVTSLELQDNKLGDDGAAAVAQLLHTGASRLVKLQLGNNGIGDQGAVALAMGIAGASALEKLSLYGNCIGSAGCQALTEAIKKNSSLKVVEYLPGNATTPLKDVKVLAKAVKQNRKYVD